jgi:hypothetical protein
MPRFKKRSNEDIARERLLKALKTLHKHGLPNLKPIHAHLAQSKGKPYSLENHFPFEPFFQHISSSSKLLEVCPTVIEDNVVFGT